MALLIFLSRLALHDDINVAIITMEFLIFENALRVTQGKSVHHRFAASRLSFYSMALLNGSVEEGCALWPTSANGWQISPAMSGEELEVGGFRVLWKTEMWNAEPPGARVPGTYHNQSWHFFKAFQHYRHIHKIVNIINSWVLDETRCILPIYFDSAEKSTFTSIHCNGYNR